MDYQIKYYKPKTKIMTFSSKTATTLKWLAFSIAVPVLYYVQDSLLNWSLDPVLKVAISAAAAYLIKIIVPALPTDETKTT